MVEYWLTRIVACVVFCTMYGVIRALISIKLGDKGGDAKKRLSLNPVLHIDTVGFIFMLFFNMGFIKPMRNQSINFKKRKKSIILVSTLPLIIMVIISTSFFVIYTHNISYTSATNGSVSFLLGNRVIPEFITYFVVFFMRISIGTLIYNLIPVYPLECEKVINYFVKPNLQMVMSQNDKVLQMVLILFTISGVLPWIVGNISIFYVSFFV